MKVSEQFGSDFFRADDFDTGGTILTIKSVELEPVGKEEKMVVHFFDSEKSLPLNRTNAEEIAEITGEDDTDDWAGSKIKIYRDKTMFGNKRVPCMRVTRPDQDTTSPSTTTSGSGSGSGKGSGKASGSSSPSAGGNGSGGGEDNPPF